MMSKMATWARSFVSAFCARLRTSSSFAEFVFMLAAALIVSWFMLPLRDLADAERGQFAISELQNVTLPEDRVTDLLCKEKDAPWICEKVDEKKAGEAVFPAVLSQRSQTLQEAFRTPVVARKDPADTSSAAFDDPVDQTDLDQYLRKYGLESIGDAKRFALSSLQCLDEVVPLAWNVASRVEQVELLRWYAAILDGERGASLSGSVLGKLNEALWKNTTGTCENWSDAAQAAGDLSKRVMTARNEPLNEAKSRQMLNILKRAWWQWPLWCVVAWVFVTIFRRCAEEPPRARFRDDWLFLALWCALGWLCDVSWFSRAWSAPIVIGVSFGCFLLFSFIGRRQAAAPVTSAPASVTASVFGLAGLALLAGLGWLLVLDLSATGHPKNRFLGLYMQTDLWAALGLFVLATQWRVTLARLYSLVILLVKKRVLQRPARAFGALVVVVAILFLSLSGMRQFTSELGKILLIVGVAAYFHSSADLNLRQGGLRAFVWPLAALGFLMGIAMVATQDFGPLLVSIYAAGLLVSGGLVYAVRERGVGKLQSMVLGVLVGAFWCFLFTKALFLAGTLSTTVEARLESVYLPLDARNDQIGVIAWFRQAAPTFGFGVGQSPWCGYGDSAFCAGVPLQIHSDYTFTALFGLSGVVGALGLFAVSLLWLCWLIGQHMRASWRNYPAQAALSWLCVCWLVLIGVQLVITVAGNSRFLPLTGITWPFVSFGKTSLWVNAFFLGLTLSMSTSEAKSEESSKISLLGATIRSAMITAGGIGVVLVFFCVVLDSHFSSASEKKDGYYSNWRLHAAMQTLEKSVVSRQKVTSPPDVSRLLEAVGKCGQWQHTLYNEGLWARLTGKPTGTRVADDVALRLAALDHWFSLKTRKGSNGPSEEPLGLDAGKWIEEANAALNPKRKKEVDDVNGEKRKLGLECADLRQALETLMPNECLGGVERARRRPERDVSEREDPWLDRPCEALKSLAWHKKTLDKQWGKTLKCKDDQHICIPERLVAQHNPWWGRAGCIYWKSPDGQQFYLSNSRGSNSKVCGNEVVAGLGEKDSSRLVAVQGGFDTGMVLEDPRWSVPPSLGIMLSSMNGLRRPTSPTYREFTGTVEKDGQAPREGATPNTVDLGFGEQAVGFSVDLTLDPETQSYAQQIASCYTGAKKVCEALETKFGAGFLKVGAGFLEEAQARMAGVVVIDIKSGRIEALAGAFSPCARQDDDGPLRDEKCARMPWKSRYRPDRLLNPSVFYEAMPASTIKPVMAAAFLSEHVGGYGNRVMAAAAPPGKQPKPGTIRYELMKSDSESFLDRMFCLDKDTTAPGVASAAACKRLWAVQKQAWVLGWNADCASDENSCGKHDLYFGLTQAEVDKDFSHLSRAIVFGRLMTEPVMNAKNEVTGYGLMPELPSLDGHTLKACKEKRWPADTCRNKLPWVNEGYGQGEARVSVVGVAAMIARLGAADNEWSSIGAPHLIETVRGVKGVVKLPRLRQASLDVRSVPKNVAHTILSGLQWSHQSGTAAEGCQKVLGRGRCNFDWIAGKTGSTTFTGGKLEGYSGRNRNVAGLRPLRWYTAVFRMPGHAGSPAWDKAIAVLVESNWKGKEATLDQGNAAVQIGFRIADQMRKPRVATKAKK